MTTAKRWGTSWSCATWRLVVSPAWWPNTGECLWAPCLHHQWLKNFHGQGERSNLVSTALTWFIRFKDGEVKFSANQSPFSRILKSLCFWTQWCLFPLMSLPSLLLLLLLHYHQLLILLITLLLALFNSSFLPFSSTSASLHTLSPSFTILLLSLFYFLSFVFSIFLLLQLFLFSFFLTDYFCCSFSFFFYFSSLLSSN